MKILFIGIHYTVDPLLSFFISEQLSPTSDLISNERYQNKQYQTLVISKAAGGGGGDKQRTMAKITERRGAGRL